MPALDSGAVVTALQNTLWGLDILPRRETPAGLVVVVESGADAEPALLAEAGLVLAPADPGTGAAWSRCVGNVGRDGDELFVGDGLVIETVAYSASAYTSLAGPTYLALETSDDLDAIEADAQAFAAGGELPEHLRSALTLFEAAALLGRRDMDDAGLRAVVQMEGTGPSPLSLGSTEALPAAEGREVSDELRVLVASVLASRVSGGHPATRFSTLPDLVIATGPDHAPTALNLRTLRAYQLGADAARLLTAAGDGGLDDVSGIARTAGIPEHLCDEAVRHCLEAVGL